MSVSFIERNDFSELYLDYIHNFQKLKSFYAFGYHTDEDFLRSINARKSSYLKNADFDRDRLADILKDQNDEFNSGESSEKNIELLREENTFAVVTGQQIGLLTGPLYTIYKALNTIKLARDLSEKHPDFHFIPVFWLECEDHDFLEINNVTVLDKKNEPINISYFDGGEQREKYLKPVGKITLDEHFENFKNELKEALQETDFTEGIFEAINIAYNEGQNLKTAFARFINRLIRDSGLVFMDPSDEKIKELCIPIYEKELKTFSQLSESVISTTADLEQRYEPQVKPRAINLFYTHEGNRYALQPHESGMIALKNSRQKFEREELFSILYTNPENFSSNVITRPIVQDFLLPTVAYVGGPSEISYFAQLKGAYEFFDVQMPIIYPRTSITLLEKRVATFLEKNDISFMDLLNERALSEKFLNESDQVNVEELFTTYLDELNSLNFRFANKLEEVDKNLVNSFKNKIQKNIEIIQDFNKKFIDAQLKANESNLVKLRSVVKAVYPDNTLQERVFNISYFLNKYSFDFVDYLYNEMDIYDFDHQVIFVNPEEN
jgi:bacillithiol synthase